MGAGGNKPYTYDLIYQGLSSRIRNYYLIAAFCLGSVIFFLSASYILNNVLEVHQRTRINVLLGLEEDLSGAGYNVHQSEIAIGSGGLEGKGFLNGTQTKLKYVPEQDKRGHGARSDTSHRYSPAILQLWRFIPLGLYHSSFHFPTPRCRQKHDKRIEIYV